MHLSPYGSIATEQWDWLGTRYPYVRLVSFVVMPNHVHGIIYIDCNYYCNCECVGNGRDRSLHNTGDYSLHNTGDYSLHNTGDYSLHNTGDCSLHNTGDCSLHNTGDHFANNIDRPKIKPLPELIGAYKTTVSKRIHLAGGKTFNWQKSFHDHIIRNARSFNMIKQYIEKNPENWTGI